MRIHQRIIVVLLLTGAFTITGMAAQDFLRPRTAGGEGARRVFPLKTLGGSVALLDDGALMILVAPQGEVDLRDRPESGVVRFTARAGTPVRVVDFILTPSKVWYLVELAEGDGQGWVPVEALATPEATGPSFTAFRFCNGDARGPIGPCGETLPLPEAGLWLRWDYAGLQRGDTSNTCSSSTGNGSPTRLWCGMAPPRGNNSSTCWPIVRGGRRENGDCNLSSTALYVARRPCRWLNPLAKKVYQL